MQDTYFMIKPEAFAGGKVGAILNQAQANGFELVQIKSFQMSNELAGKFYGIHKERPFFADLVKYMTSGTVVGCHLRREDAVKRMRELVGATNPEDATAGTIRFLHGASIGENAVHASDSPENAKTEIGQIFG